MNNFYFRILSNFLGSLQEIGYGEIENILKTAEIILIFLKKLLSPLPQFRILREDEAIKMSNRLKTVGHLYKKAT